MVKENERKINQRIDDKEIDKLFKEHVKRMSEMDEELINKYTLKGVKRK